MPFNFRYNSDAKAECIWGGILLGVAGVGEVVYLSCVDNPEIWPPALIGVVGIVGLGLLLHGLLSAYKRDENSLRTLMIDAPQPTTMIIN